MTRGRKKGGIQINSINDKEELRNMIINQINSLNKKITKFKNEGIYEHTEYIKNIISEDMGNFLENDTLSKSKKFYSEKDTVWLKKTLSALHKANNHYAYGTVRKYNSELNMQMQKLKTYTEDLLRKKGYSEDFINTVTSSKDFYVKAFDAFGNGEKYGSDQTIEKIALNYENTDMSDEEKNRILHNIEYSHNVQKRIKEEKDAFEEFKRNRKMR